MRIVIDMQGAQSESRFRGIGRYTMSVSKAIARNRGKHEVFLVLNGLFHDTIEPVRASFNGLLPQENILVWSSPGPVSESDRKNRWRREVAELIRERYIARLDPDIVLLTSLFEGYIDDAVVTVSDSSHFIISSILYDLIPLVNKDLYLKSNKGYAEFYKNKLEHLKKVDLFLAISSSSAREGGRVLSLPDETIVNISTACDPVFETIEITESAKVDFLSVFSITKPFILYAGGADERKNLHRLVRAYAKLPNSLRDEHQLVFVGQIHADKVAELRKTAKSAGLHEEDLIFVGHTTDLQLAYFYNLCSLFVIPSLHEGFGLPALEAMSCGAPTIGANATSIPEVIGRQDVLFDPYDEVSISNKITEVLSDIDFKNEIVVQGLKQCKKFSWDETARQVLLAFSKAEKNTRSSSNHEVSLSQLTSQVATLVPEQIKDSELVGIAYAINRIRSYGGDKQLFVDISELVQRDARTGVQRVTRSILKELLDSPPEGYLVRPVYSTIDMPGYRYAQQFVEHLNGRESCVVDELIEYRPGDIFLGLDLQHHTTRVQKNYLLSMRHEGVRVVFVVYDLLPIHFPHCWPSKHSVHDVHHEWLHTISHFDGAICISKAVANELFKWQSMNGPKRLRPFEINWFHLGADVSNSVPTKGLPENFNNVLEGLKRRPTFLAVGTLEPRKRQEQILDSFDLLWSKGIDSNLVVVGKQGWMVEELASKIHLHPELNKRLFWLEGISDEYLEKIYEVSSCLVAASEGEGFGLPLIEAAQHKLPIIARDIPVFREVARDFAFYFDSFEPEGLSLAIVEWLQLYKNDAHPRSDNMPWITWKQSAEQLKRALLGSKTFNAHSRDESKV
ncbi:glycosyltransferase family 4 protein [Billgrantia antri]|uniref:Glycosyltransferase family 4 protein n=1 Tax=Halomonas sulfidivorans TaxID=2733488 RepID=A0ABX7WH70_9GAMM|nr:glycosyltransferase family 1 protein [Halomonas sulfidivorans]QTP58887.1 glycosyltransferase family 4 protein [Halomonas sulfidivorans]